MVHGVLVASSQKISGQRGTGKTTLCLGLLHLLKARFSRIGYFKPIGKFSDERYGDGKANADAYLIEKSAGLALSAQQMSAVTAKQLHDAMLSATFDHLIDRILQAYKTIAKQCDFIVCEGVNFRGSITPYEFDVNVELSRNLNAPILLVCNDVAAPLCICQRTAQQQMVNGIVFAYRQAALKECDIVGVALNETDKLFADAVRQELTTNYSSLGANVMGAIPRSDLLRLLDAIPDHGIGGTGVLFPTIGEHKHRRTELVRSLVNDNLEIEPIVQHATSGVGSTCQRRTTPRQFVGGLIDLARQNRQRIVLAEGHEPRVLKAVDALIRTDAVELTLLGEPTQINEQLQGLGLKFEREVQIIDPATSKYREKFARHYMELRAKKNPTYEKSFGVMGDVTYFGTMMVEQGLAGGMVSGAITTTAATLRPSLEFVKTKPGYAIASSVFFICLRSQVLVFGDCAVNPNPTAAQLADIALASAETAQAFGIEPRVAMLSYATGSSARGPEVELVEEATRLVREKKHDFLVDGPLQYDAAIDAAVAKTKLPNSEVAGRATVFIFPNLSAGNNAYKAVQRASKCIAIGPIMQGMRKPVNDLSRGCTVQDIINTVLMTAVQAQRNN